MKMIRILIVLAGLLASGLALAADEAIKAVYHLVDGQAQSTRAMANIRNHLDADPTVKIVVVAHGAGIDFLLDGAMDAKGQSFAGPIGELANRGVKFRVCNNTLVTRGVPKDRVVMEASIVPSGVAEIARLQAKEGFVYVRP
jgi:intracellular sulfur oxidation DsrE/DsrF family protein